MAGVPGERAADEIDHFLESAKALRAQLRTNEANYRKLRRLLDRGADMRTILDSIDAGSARQDLSDALDELERSRHEVKLLIATEGLRQGMSIGEIGRAWGVSRQLAARYAKEARQRSSDASASA
jgi:DnaJ-domain-containing protein 1